MLPWAYGATPYVTPDQLITTVGTVTATSWPVGAQWATIPFTSGGTVSALAQQAVLATVCREATTKAEQIAGQPLRATVVTEILQGPHFRVTVQDKAVPGPKLGRFIASRSPVTQVLSVATCPNATFPRVWTPVPAGNFEPEMPILGVYGSNVPDPSGGDGGQGILIAPGYVNWCLGRKGWRIKTQYVSGWPHASITAAGTAGSLTMVVDDITGWAPVLSPQGVTQGATGLVYDALGGGQEAITCIAASPATAGAVSGPGTLTLLTPANYAHNAGIMVSALPESVIFATAMLAAADAITRGAQATTISTTGTGRQQKATPDWLCEMAEHRLKKYRRIV